MLRIHTLGGLSVHLADGRRPAASAIQPRRLAVLAIVARAGNRGVTRERILALLWPDADEEAGRKALSQALWTLRTGLAADGLFVGMQELSIDPSVASIDVVDLEAAVANRDLERASELYAGPFLDGFRVPGAPEFDRWMEEERGELAHRHQGLLERLAARATETGDHAAAVGWWRRRAAIDPLNARVAVALMRSLDAAGDRSAALQHARIYEALIDQELGVGPDRDVIALAEQLRRAAAAPAPPAPRTVPRPGAPLASEPEAAASSPPPPPPPPATPIAVPAATPVVAAAPPVAPPTAAEPPAPTPVPRAPRRSTTSVLVQVRLRPRRVLMGVALVGLAVVGITGLVRRRLPQTSAAEPAPARKAGAVLAVGRIADYRDERGGLAGPVIDMLATNLARVPGLEVVSNTRMLELSSRTSAAGQGDASAAARAGGATDLLEGALSSLADGRLLLDLRRVDVASGAVRGAYRFEGKDVFVLVSQATDELARAMGRAAPGLDPADVSTRSVVAYRFYEEGLRHLARADLTGAERLLAAAVREDSTFAMAAFQLWRARSLLGVYQPHSVLDRAAALAERATDRERLIVRGHRALAAWRPELRAIADTLAIRYPDDPDGLYLVARARLEDGDAPGAIPVLRRLLELHPLTPDAGTVCRACDALEPLIFAYQSLDSQVVADRLARDWVRVQPRSARAWATLRGQLIHVDRVDEALAAHRTATSIDRTGPFDDLFPAIIRVRVADFETAERALAPMVRDATDWWRPAFVQLLALRYQGRWAEARAYADAMGARVDPGPLGAGLRRPLQQVRGLIASESGDRREAMARFDTLTRMPMPDAAPGQLARLRAMQHAMAATSAIDAADLAAAQRHTDSVREWSRRSGNPRDARLVAYLQGRFAAARADTAAAIAAMRAAIFWPTTGVTRVNLDLGRILLAQGRAAEAMPLLRAALRGPLDNTNVFASHSDLHELLGRSFEQLGQRDSAVVHWRWVERAFARADGATRARADTARAHLGPLTRR